MNIIEKAEKIEKALLTVLYIIFSILFFIPSSVESRVNLPHDKRVHADKKAVEELVKFYDDIDKAMAKEDVKALMEFYSDEYNHHGITKRQLKFMWLELFTNYNNLYSSHIFIEVSVTGSDAILVCTGALLGEPKGETEEVATVDKWVNQTHWLSKIKGKWKIVGGATHKTQGGRVRSNMELHPLF